MFNSRIRHIYLAGPMTGYPEFNYPLFRKVTAELRGRGHVVYDPSEFPHNSSAGPFPFRKAFVSYSTFICLTADTIVLLPGHEYSIGATAERALARVCGIDAFEYITAGVYSPHDLKAEMPVRS